jgi:ketosteroid isomerase-like protein
MTTSDPISRFTASIESAGVATAEVFCDDVRLDATVPHWRFQVRGAEAVAAELSRWYSAPGQFEDLRRTPLADGELVEFTLAWQEDGVPHASHQAHVLTVREGRIAADRVWCGGRWPAALLAEMEEAQRAADRAQAQPVVHQEQAVAHR